MDGRGGRRPSVGGGVTARMSNGGGASTEGESGHSERDRRKRRRREHRKAKNTTREEVLALSRGRRPRARGDMDHARMQQMQRC